MGEPGEHPRHGAGSLNLFHHVVLDCFRTLYKLLLLLVAGILTNDSLYHFHLRDHRASEVLDEVVSEEIFGSMRSRQIAGSFVEDQKENGANVVVALVVVEGHARAEDLVENPHELGSYLVAA